MNLSAFPWPKMITPSGQEFFGRAEEVYNDWMKRTSSKRLSIALLAIAELRSGLSPSVPLYGEDEESEKEDHTVEEQNDAAWAEISKDPLRHVLAASNSGDAARALIQYWDRPHDHKDGERAAALADRWTLHGNLT